jgi:hypothetical protein
MACGRKEAVVNTAAAKPKIVITFMYFLLVSEMRQVQ